MRLQVYYVRPGAEALGNVFYFVISYGADIAQALRENQLGRQLLQQFPVQLIQSSLRDKIRADHPVYFVTGKPFRNIAAGYTGNTGSLRRIVAFVRNTN